MRIATVGSGEAWTSLTQIEAGLVLSQRWAERKRRVLVIVPSNLRKADRYPNLTVKRIPKQVLSRCEWAHDDYSLQVQNLPKAPPKPGQQVMQLV